ncbi:AraC family transcriptional regulator [uncultured Marivita sp.]|uniref:helix-turn-helix domain-containing protein n=1 Tax=uncultured Marivita sp. TaxID=888080 RepID=UPI00261F7D2F|nr:AraC family transcriptional regulator [uncultured Marivita sp.]
MSARVPHFDFTGAIDLAVAIGGEVLPSPSETLEMSAFTFGSHSSEVFRPPTNLLFLADRSTGKLRAEANGTIWEKETRPGLLTFAPAGVPQFYDFRGETTNILVSVDDALLRAVSQDSDVAWRMGALEPDLAFHEPRLADLIRRQCREVSKADMGWRAISEGLTLVLAGELFRRFSGMRKSEQSPLSAMQVTIVEDFMEANLDENLGLTDLARLVGLDVYGFARAFKAATGQSAIQALIGRRVARVEALLRTTSLPLAEIAYACGFSSQAHMTTVFGKHMGTTPGRYRREVRG